jgi:Protein of unknown function (DUF1822)
MHPSPDPFRRLHSTMLHALPQPGEIWKIRQSVQCSVNVYQPHLLNLFSKTAQAYLLGEPGDRYVMIVKEPEPEGDEHLAVSVMVLSSEIQYLSQSDLCIPSHLSGLSFDLLAETWHVLKMLVCNLLEPVGDRLTRSFYDQLLTVGDAGAIDSSLSSPFHQQERAWSDVLRVPLAVHQAYIEAMAVAQHKVERAIQLERNLRALAPQVRLSQWVRNQFEAGWLTVAEVMSGDRFQYSGARSLQTEAVEPDAIVLSQLIQQLAPDQSAQQQCRAARRLGELTQGHPNAIAALVGLMHQTQDEEVFWTGLESLAAIAPNHPAIGIRRVKRIDLGMEGDRLALSVTMAQRMNQAIAVLLQIYPVENAVLPEQLQLTLLDDGEQPIRTVIARQDDLYIQLKLTGQVDEQFAVRIALGDASVTECFLI